MICLAIFWVYCISSKLHYSINSRPQDSKISRRNDSAAQKSDETEKKYRPVSEGEMDTPKQSYDGSTSNSPLPLTSLRYCRGDTTSLMVSLAETANDIVNIGKCWKPR